MSTPTAIIDALGVSQLSAKLGVGKSAVLNARNKPLLPGRWYAPVREMCAEAGLECPLGLFNWSRPAPEKGKRASAEAAQ